MSLLPLDWWDIDPLPVPPTSDVTLMTWWRWYAKQTLARRLA